MGRYNYNLQTMAHSLQGFNPYKAPSTLRTINECNSSLQINNDVITRFRDNAVCFVMINKIK